MPLLPKLNRSGRPLLTSACLEPSSPDHKNRGATTVFLPLIALFETASTSFCEYRSRPIRIHPLAGKISSAPAMTEED
jgi:hypothetical protein